MIRGAIGNLDVAQIVLYAFFVFFAGLIFYLRREDRREGYPLEDEAAGRLKDPGFLLIPAPKTFRRSDGRQVSAPNFRADTRSINATKTEPWPGAPLQPNGDPMLAGVGPGSYAERADETGKTHRWSRPDRSAPGGDELCGLCGKRKSNRLHRCRSRQGARRRGQGSVGRSRRVDHALLRG